MAWTYNGIRIYVQEKETARKQIIARLQPVNGPTVLQVFGYESLIIRLKGKVVGQNNAVALDSLIASGTAFQLVGPTANSSLYPSNITLTEDPSGFQTIDTAQDCLAPVYTFTMELYD